MIRYKAIGRWYSIIGQIDRSMDPLKSRFRILFVRYLSKMTKPNSGPTRDITVISRTFFFSETNYALQ